MVARTGGGRAAVALAGGADDDPVMRSLAALIVLAACGAGTPVEPEEPKRDPKEAIREARGLIDEAYRSLRSGDVVGLQPILAPDLFFVGPGPADVGLDRSAALALGQEYVDDRQKHKLKSYSLEVFAGPNGRSAYAIDQLEFDGTAFAVTVVAAEVGDMWMITTIAISRAVSAKRLDSAAVLAELPAWRPSTTEDEPAHAKAPRQLVEALTLAASDLDARLTQYGKDPDAAYVGPSPDEVILGTKALGKKWKKRAPAWEIDASLGGATSDERLVWVLANARDAARPAKDDRDRDDRDRDDRDRRRRRDDDEADAAEPPAAAPRRLFAIYRDDGGEAGWRLAVLHAAVALAR